MLLMLTLLRGMSRCHRLAVFCGRKRATRMDGGTGFIWILRWSEKSDFMPNSLKGCSSWATAMLSLEMLAANGDSISSRKPTWKSVMTSITLTQTTAMPVRISSLLLITPSHFNQRIGFTNAKPCTCGGRQRSFPSGALGLSMNGGLCCLFWWLWTAPCSSVLPSLNTLSAIPSCALTTFWASAPVSAICWATPLASPLILSLQRCFVSLKPFNLRN